MPGGARNRSPVAAIGVAVAQLPGLRADSFDCDSASAPRHSSPSTKVLASCSAHDPPTPAAASPSRRWAQRPTSRSTRTGGYKGRCPSTPSQVTTAFPRQPSSWQLPHARATSTPRNALRHHNSQQPQPLEAQVGAQQNLPVSQSRGAGRARGPFPSPRPCITRNQGAGEKGGSRRRARLLAGRRPTRPPLNNGRGSTAAREKRPGACRSAHAHMERAWRDGR